MASAYKKLSPLEHILARPDTYIGSIHTEVDRDYLLADDGSSMQVRSVEFNPGLFKIFDEIITNAIDQSVVDPTLDSIKVDINPRAGSISVFNSGKGIPIEKHAEYGVHVPELIFGQLLTSSNYDDGQERIVGGKNGLGAKLTNVYSTKLEVEVVDMASKQKYKQTFENNMTKAHAPKITALSNPKNGSVKITFWPDLARFGLESLAAGDNVALMQRRVWDAAACTHAGVKVYYQGKVVPVKTFEKYVDLFLNGAKKVYEKSSNGRWEICVAASPSGFRHMSFVNGIATSKGGTHLNYVVNQVIDGLKGLNKKKDLDIKPAFIKDHMSVFVKSTLVNPSFSSQSKQECTSKVSSFGSKASLAEDFFKKAAKLGILDEAIALAKHKEVREMSKTDGRKKSTIKGIPKLEDANKAGTADSRRCTLLITEGGKHLWIDFPTTRVVVDLSNGNISVAATLPCFPMTCLP
jgi:DNA topoisomerase II